MSGELHHVTAEEIDALDRQQAERYGKAWTGGVDVTAWARAVDEVLAPRIAERLEAEEDRAAADAKRKRKRAS